MPVTDHIRKKLSTVPHKPGVYLHKDRFGTVIYVGKARDLRKRVSQYFHPSRRMGWDLKFNALVEAIHDFDVHTVKSEPEALLLESKLIKEFHPRYNISFRDDKRFILLKVNLNDPIPRFTFTRIKQEDGARYFGPFTDSGAARRTLAFARKQFNLRGCRPLTPNQTDYKHCLYANLKYCTAPCIGNVTGEQYLQQVAAACDFLSGQCEELKQQLEAEMKKAAGTQDYEKAAAAALEVDEEIAIVVVEINLRPGDVTDSVGHASDHPHMDEPRLLLVPPQNVIGQNGVIIAIAAFLPQKSLGGQNCRREFVLEILEKRGEFFRGQTGVSHKFQQSHRGQPGGHEGRNRHRNDQRADQPARNPPPNFTGHAVHRVHL